MRGTVFVEPYRIERPRSHLFSFRSSHGPSTTIGAASVRSKAETLDLHMGHIVDACKVLYSELTAIVLYGGYGRNEGSWFQGDNGVWRPYNDYDIRVVTTRSIPQHALESLEKNLAERIGIRWIDLGQSHPNELKHLRPSILNYDLKNASRVVYGDSSVLDLIPRIDSSTLPMKEVQVLFFTRLYTLIGSLGEAGLARGLSGDESRFFRNQMAKAVLAIVDVLLLTKGAYHPSYRTRVERLHALFQGRGEILRLSRWALEEKLEPRSPAMSSEEMLGLYASVHKHYFKEMYQALSLHLGRQVDGPGQIAWCAKWRPRSVMTRVYGLLRSRGLQMERQLAVMLAQSYIAAAWTPDGVRGDFVARGMALLRQVDEHVPLDATWDRARVEVARIRMEV